MHGGVGLPKSVATNERRTMRKGVIEKDKRRFVNQARGGSHRMTARRVEQARRLVNRTHTKLCCHATAAQRLAFSRSPGGGEHDRWEPACSCHQSVKSPRQGCRLQRGVRRQPLLIRLYLLVSQSKSLPLLGLVRSIITAVGGSGTISGDAVQ